MADPTTEGNTASSPSQGRWRRIVLLTGLVLGLAVLGSVWWLWSRVEDLEADLARSVRWSEFIERKLHEVREEAGRYSSQAEAAKARAAEAEQEAQEMSRARRDAELEREFAREEAERSRLETARARAEAVRSKEQAERLRRMRERELHRMQQALSQIAETIRTPMGMVVNLTEDSFLFDFDDAALRAENREILSRIAGVLLASHGYRLYVYGHTDDTGPDGYNQQLSLRRARSVRDYLVEAGLPENIIDVQGFGEGSPKIDSANRQARQKNRRVEIGIIDTVIDFELESGGP